MQKKFNTIDKVQQLTTALEKIKSAKKGDKVEMFKKELDALLETEKERQEQESSKKA